MFVFDIEDVVGVALGSAILAAFIVSLIFKGILFLISGAGERFLKRRYQHDDTELEDREKDSIKETHEKTERQKR